MQVSTATYSNGRLGTGTVRRVGMDWRAVEIVRSPVPAYRQLAAAVAEAVTAGRLRPGDGLPSEDGIAAAVGVSRDTVRRALDVLRSAGVIVTSTGIGSFISSGDADGVGTTADQDQILRGDAG
jgi:DNA-binding GntR family transcriptional regulator